MVKVVNEKKLEKTLNHTQYMYMLQKIPLFFFLDGWGSTRVLFI